MKFKGLFARLIVVAAVSISSSVLLQVPVFAQQAACQEDLARFCQGVQGRKQQMACLRQNREQLSPACKQHLVEAMRTAKQMHQACGADIQTFCQGVQQGGGRVMQCLKAHRTELSPGCKESIAEMLMSR
jgi:chorismate synthase